MSKKNRRSRQTELMIDRFFLDLLQKKPLSGISVTELCRLAELDRSTFYLHYCDIYALMEHIEAAQLADMQSRIDALRQADITGEEVVRTILLYLREHRSVFRVLLREGSPAFWTEVRRRLQDYFRETVCRQYPEAASLPAHELEDIIVFLTNGYYGIYRRWILLDSLDDPDYIASLSTQLSTACLTSRFK